MEILPGAPVAWPVRLAMFDLDWTLIRPVFGVFPTSSTDYAFLPERVRILQTYVEDGFTIVIITNQGLKGRAANQMKTRLLNVQKDLRGDGVDPWICAAIGPDSIYRKPSPLLYKAFLEEAKISFVKEAFFVGDAAGRPGDFAASDKEFAAAINVPFFTPEEIFPVQTVDIPTDQTVFIFVGMPGSGKTSYYERYFAPLGYVHINRDKLKTEIRVVNAYRKALEQGKSIVIDETNPVRARRDAWCQIASEYGVQCETVYFVGNGFQWNKSRVSSIPIVAYRVYFSKLEEPANTVQIDRLDA